MMGNKVFKALTAVAAAAAAAWLLPKRKKEMAVRPVPAGESMSCIRERTGVNEDALCLYYYRPGRWTEKDAVFIAFHGFGRDGAEYCKALRKLAEERNMLIVCPELTERKYPGAEWYQEGGIMDADGHIREKEERTFSAADQIVAEVKNRTQATGEIILFGHSAGGQFVHRWALLGGKKNVDVIAVANSGWFTMPDRDIDYPYGIKNVGITDEELGEAFAEPVILFMGEKDVERKPPFRDTPEADAQEPNGTVYELFPTMQSKSGGAQGSFPLETGNRRRRGSSGGKNGGRCSGIYFWEIIGRWKSESVSWELSAISC